MEQKPNQVQRTTSRRAFLGKSLTVGAGAIGAGLLIDRVPAFARGVRSGGLTKGDVAILRFLAAAEILETDLWQQYNELGGIQDSEVPGGSGTLGDAYGKALRNLDGDMSQYIHDNTEDEISHFKFLNAYLMAHGADPVNLDHFRILPSSKATGAQQIGRLTNLMQLTVDTSYWTRYRSRTQNPDLGDTFLPAIPTLSAGKFPAIPRDNNDLNDPNVVQAIANTAAFHFGFIEQGGSSLYPSLAQRVTHPEVLRILLAIGPTETSHFQIWHDKAGNAVSDPLAPLTVSINGQTLSFPNLNLPAGDEDTQTNLIMPEPTVFLRGLPAVSIIRPTQTDGAAMGAVKGLTADGLFIGQSPAFFAALRNLAKAADQARHGV